MFSSVDARRALERIRVSSGPILLVLLLTFVVAAVIVPLLGGGNFLSVANVRNIFIRSVALGLVSVGQTLVILGASIDLSVAYMVSVAAVLASFIMQSDPDRMVLAVVVVLAVGAGVGLVNGLVITKFRVNPLMATLGTGLIMSGFLNASFQNFAGSVPREFQVLGYARIGRSRCRCCSSSRWPQPHRSCCAPRPSATTSTPWVAISIRRVCRGCVATGR